MLRSALLGQLVAETSELEGAAKAKAEEMAKALAKARVAKAPTIAAKNINDPSLHDSRYVRAVKAGTPHHVAWREERQRRRAIVNRKKGTRERALERQYYDRQWHERFDNPERSGGLARVEEDEENIDADVDTEVIVDKSETMTVGTVRTTKKGTTLTEFSRKERTSFQQFPNDEANILASDPKKKVKGKRVRNEDYKKRKNAARNKARKARKKGVAATAKAEDEDDEDDEPDSPGVPDEPRDRPGGRGDGSSGGAPIPVCSLACNEAKEKGSWNGWKYMELNLDTGAAITAIPVKDAQTHHIALGPQGGRLIARNTEAGRAYSKMMKQLIKEYGHEMIEVKNRKGIYVMDCWMSPSPLTGQPVGA